MSQLDRAKRYLYRIDRIYAGVPYEEDARDDYVDDVLSFFMHCYHVRDWLIEGKRYGVTRKEVDDFIRGNEPLKVCGDLCNVTKHVRLTSRWTPTGIEPRVMAVSLQSTGKNGVFHTTQGSISIASGDSAYDALELAYACMKSWYDFIASAKKRHA